MSFTDPFSESRRRLRDLFREALRRMEEIEAEMMETIERMMEEVRDLEAMMDYRVSELERGEMEPLVSMIDRGSHILMVIEMPGAVGDTVEVIVKEDEVSVSAEISEEAVASLGWAYWARKGKARFRGSYRLPFRVDPSRVEVKRMGSRVLIRIPKA